MTFSQLPGFAEHFAAYPRAGARPSASDQALLARHRPRVFLPPKHPGPVSFYDDYIAQGRLIGGDGRTISGTVGQALLNTHKDDPGVTFVHAPRRAPATRARASREPATAVVFGRVNRDIAAFPQRNGGIEQHRFTFLSYNLVFRHSGLPAGQPFWQLWLVDLLASRHDWHQLDHYTAVTLVLDETEAPAAVMFQQHNYLRSYALGSDLELPTDGRPRVDVAIGSNELYPHRPERSVRRAAAFLGPRTVNYLVTGEDPPGLRGDDVTHGVREVDYDLAFLAPTDAFYTFAGRLGARRRLPGRDGPPGADYNTPPAFKPPAMQLLAFYWHEDQRDYVDLVRGGLFAGRPDDALRAVLAGRFWAAWRGG